MAAGLQLESENNDANKRKYGTVPRPLAGATHSIMQQNCNNEHHRDGRLNDLQRVRAPAIAIFRPFVICLKL